MVQHMDLTRGLAAAALALSVAFAAGPAAAQSAEDPVGGCDPEVWEQQQEVAAAATQGVADRAEEQIKQPEPLMDLSCIGNFSIPGMSLSLDFEAALDSLLDQARDMACSAAQDAISSVTEQLDPNTMFPGLGDLTSALNQIPGVNVSTTQISFGRTVDPDTGELQNPYQFNAVAPNPRSPSILLPTPDGSTVEIEPPSLGGDPAEPWGETLEPQ